MLSIYTKPKAVVKVTKSGRDSKRIKACSENRDRRRLHFRISSPIGKKKAAKVIRVKMPQVKTNASSARYVGLRCEVRDESQVCAMNCEQPDLERIRVDLAYEQVFH